MLPSESASFVLPASPIYVGSPQLEGSYCEFRPPTLPRAISTSSVASAKVVEVLVQHDAFDCRKAAFEHIRDALKTNSLLGNMFKVTMLPRKNGIRIWLCNFEECAVTEDLVPFLHAHLAKLESVKFRIRVLTNEGVEDLRWQHEHVKAHIQRVGSEISTAGLRVADNLSALLLKRNNPHSAATQRRVGRLVDLVTTVNTVVGRRVRVEDKSVSEHLQSLEEDDEDPEPA